MTRVSIFNEKNSYYFEAWEEASQHVKSIADDVTIAVLQGHNRNFTDLTIECKSLGLMLTFSLCDLWQERSSMLDSIGQCINMDSNDERFDFWDRLPPFGVVHIYDSKLNRQPNTADEDLASFFTLFDHFLLKHFMMYVFYEGEEVCSYLLNRASDKTFVHNGQRGYRNSTY